MASEEQESPRIQHEYSILAQIYDHVMYDVNYELWARFIDDILQVHHPKPQELLELACGTGTLSLSLDQIPAYNILATDKSSAMLKQARSKAVDKNAGVQFRQIDFTHIDLERTFDAAILLFDSLNYLHSQDKILDLIAEVENILNPGGLFVFDFTTPRNSNLAVKTLNNETGSAPQNIQYHRRSYFDEVTRLHTNDFLIRQWNEERTRVQKTYRELHQQKIYSLSEIVHILEQTNFNIVAKYSGFDLVEADEDSLRITIVARCQKTR